VPGGHGTGRDACPALRALTVTRADGRPSRRSGQPSQHLDVGSHGPAALTYTDEDPPARPTPSSRPRRSAAAQAKASYQHDPAGQSYRSFHALLDHLATLTRNQVRFTWHPGHRPDAHRAD
jgi:hypothetical protein